MISLLILVCIMLLFEHKQYLQSYTILMPTKMAGRDYNELLPGSVTSQTSELT